jgi:hypothetical protein
MPDPAYSTSTPTPTTLNAKSRAATVAAAKAPVKATARPAAVAVPKPGIVDKITDSRLPGIEITLELITPERAEHYLDKLPPTHSDIQQRNLSTKTVDRYALDMASENWPFAGDPIRFNVDGELIDGQHRLRGVMQSKVAQMMIVIRGLERETFAVFDTGRARSFSDVLKSRGVPNVAIVSGLTRRVLHWQRGNYGVQNVPRVLNPGFLGVPASPGVLLKTFEQMESPIINAARRGNQYKNMAQPKTAAPGILAFTYLLFSHLDLERTELFFHELQVGPRQLGPEYPIFVLRERMKERVAAGKSGSPDWVWLYFFINTWNAWYEGKSMKALRTPPAATITHLALPKDPHEADRPQGWTPLGGVA